MKKILDMVRKNFEARLSVKTNWGRNEVQLALEGAISDTLAEFIDVSMFDELLKITSE